MIQKFRDRSECKKYIKVTKKRTNASFDTISFAGPMVQLYIGASQQILEDMYAKDFSLIELNMTKTESEVQEIYDFFKKNLINIRSLSSEHVRCFKNAR